MLPFMASWTTPQPQPQNLTRQQPPAAEINLENNGLSVNIAPTLGNKVKGILTVKLNSVPSKADNVLVSFVQQGYSGPMENLTASRKGLLEWLMEPKAGAEVFLDTSKVENGVYGFGIAVGYEGAPENNPWLALVQTQVLVDNTPASSGNATG